MRTRRTYFWRFLDQNEDEDPAFYNQPRRFQSTLRDVHDTEALEDHTKNMKMGILEVVKESADPSRSLTIGQCCSCA
ncbi:hypothetical protein MHYP_G00042380 [Metynnis hypsauchen]